MKTSASDLVMNQASYRIPRLRLQPRGISYLSPPAPIKIQNSVYTRHMNNYTIEELREKYLRLQKEYRELIIEKNEDDITIDRLNRILQVMNENFENLLKLHLVDKPKK